MKRLEQCAALGMWDFAAYVIAPSYSCANDVAHMYLSLTQGEKIVHGAGGHQYLAGQLEDRGGCRKSDLRIAVCIAASGVLPESKSHDGLSAVSLYRHGNDYSFLAASWRTH